MSQQKLNELSHKIQGMRDFDIRQLHSYELVDPLVKVLPSKDRRAQMQAMLKQIHVYNFEKDDLEFDVFEIQNAKELCLRIKVFRKDTFEMLTSCDIGEEAMRKELTQDKRSFLSQPQQREQLARYLIENSFFDESTNMLKFLKSDLIEEIEV